MFVFDIYLEAVGLLSGRQKGCADVAEYFFREYYKPQDKKEQG